MSPNNVRGGWRTIAALALALSMLVAPVCFAGSAEATEPRAIDGEELGDESPVYAGERFNVTFDEEPFNRSDELYLIATDPFVEDEWDHVRTLRNDSDTGGEFFIEAFDTTDLDGYYVFANSTSPRDEVVDAAEDTRFLVTDEELDAEWDDDVATADDREVPLVIDSARSRGDYNVTISADGLDYEELRALFVHDGTDVAEVTDPAHLPLDRLGYDRGEGDDVTDIRDDDYITLNLSDSTDFQDEGELLANVTNLEETEGLSAIGGYDFEVLVTDTGSEDAASIVIGETNAEFDRSLYTRAAGDVVEISVDLEATDDAFIQIGDREAGFVDVLYVEDGDDDGTATFVANTRLVGTDHSEVSGVGQTDTDVVYYSDDDTVESYVHDGEIAGTAADVTRAKFFDDPNLESADELSFEEYLRELELIDEGQDPSEQLVRPLQPVDYPIVVDRRHHFVIDDGEPTVDDRIGSAELDLVQPSVRDVTTWVGPAADADEEVDVDEIRDDLTERDVVAIGDRAVVGFETTGLVGAMATIDYVENGNDISEGIADGFSPNVLAELADDPTEWLGEGIAFRFEGPDRPNQASNVLDLASAYDREAYLLTDLQRAENDPGYLYVVIDTEDEPFRHGLADGEAFDVGLEYAGADDRYRFVDHGGTFGGAGGDDTEPAYPYYPRDFSRNATATLTVEEPTVTFDRTDDGVVQVAPDEEAVVSGRTNVAPGSDATVSVRLPPPGDALPDEDPSFLAERAVEIRPDGSFSAELDLSDRVVGEEAYVALAVDETNVDVVDALFADVDEVRAPFFAATIDAPETVETDDGFDVTVTVTNVGDEFGTADLRVLAGGDLVASASVDLEPGEEGTVSEPIAAGDEPGTIDVLASTQDDAASASVTVGDGDDPDEGGVEDESDDTANDGGEEADDEGADAVDPEAAAEADSAIPGFGPIVAGLAIAIAVALRNRR